MNLSRAYTLGCNEEFSVGRVQTPTLAMIVERELAIRNFVPEDYRNVVATFSPASQSDKYTGHMVPPGRRAHGRRGETCRRRRRSQGHLRAGRAAARRTSKRSRRRPGACRRRCFYDLTELQRHANRLYGFSAQRTLELAQALYEQHKLISYPRTDSRHLSQDVARTLPKIVKAIRGDYEGLHRARHRRAAARHARSSTTRRSAITTRSFPTGVSPAKLSLDPDERKIFDLDLPAPALGVARRSHLVRHDGHHPASAAAVDDRFHSSGTAVVQIGWKVLDIASAKKTQGQKTEDGESAEEGQKLPSGSRAGPAAAGSGCRVDREEDPALRSASPKARC